MAGRPRVTVYPADMSVECANDGSAWALRTGPGAAMSQEPHVGYHADQAGATPIFAEQYFQTPGGKPVAESPGSDAGPFSAIDAASAVFVDWCSACGPGTAPWDIATNSGSTLTKEGNVGSITQPQAASFLSPQVGWVAGNESVFPTSAKGTPKSQERIVATTDGGRTWHLRVRGPLDQLSGPTTGAAARPTGVPTRGASPARSGKPILADRPAGVSGQDRGSKAVGGAAGSKRSGADIIAHSDMIETTPGIGAPS